MAIRTLKHATITGLDGAPVSLALTPGPVDFSISGLQAGQYNAIPVMNGGEFLELVEGERTFPTFSMTLLQNTKLIDNSVNTPGNLVLKRGSAGGAGYASGTTKDPGAVVWTVNITLVLNRAGASETWTLQNVRLTIDFGTEADGNKIKLSGTVYGLASTGASNEPITFA